MVQAENSAGQGPERFTGEEVKRMLEAKGITLKANSMPVVAEEAPGAYKDVDDVVNTCHKAGISLLVGKNDSNWCC